jgi:hypothetical protein
MRQPVRHAPDWLPAGLPGVNESAVVEATAAASPRGAIGAAQSGKDCDGFDKHLESEAKANR